MIIVLPSIRSAEYEFGLSSREGALRLVLPEGAEHCDLRHHRLSLQAAIVMHSAEWYRFAEERVDQIISHDSILISGFDSAADCLDDVLDSI